MDWFSRHFLKAALLWLGCGVVVGLAMAVRPAWLAYRPVHTHLNLLGFVAMTIFGVAYHVIPRFAGHPLHSPSLAGWHWYLANLGLVLLLAGFALIGTTGPAARYLTITGGSISALSAFLFIYNMWRTLDGRRRPSSPGASGLRPLTVVEPPTR
jgi:cbb3-type cytochrome oxidase subunit 1